MRIMKLIDCDKENFSVTLSKECSPTPLTPSSIEFVSDLNGLRALWGSIRECREEIPEKEFESRLGFTSSTILAWKETLRNVYDTVEQVTGQPLDSRPVFVVTTHNQTIPQGKILLEADSRELTAYANMLEATIDEIEDWEYHTRMGFDKDEIRAMIRSLREI